MPVPERVKKAVTEKRLDYEWIEDIIQDHAGLNGNLHGDEFTAVAKEIAEGIKKGYPEGK